MRTPLAIFAGVAFVADVLGVSLGAAVAISACGRAPARRAEAALEPRSGSEAKGKAVFVETAAGVQATISVEKATPGDHGIHLHERGDCSAPDAQSAGGHWDPDQSPHGQPGKPAHAGDLGNISVGEDGKGRLQVVMSKMSVRTGTHSVVGKAVVLHAEPDDLMSQPEGKAGARIACGVVKES